MARFGVGIMDFNLVSRPTPESLTRATYLNALANRVDSLWVPDHLNGLFPRSLWKQQYCGATKLVPTLDAYMEPWTMLGHLAGRNRAGRMSLGTSVTTPVDAPPPSLPRPRRRCTYSPAAGQFWASARGNAKAMSPTELIGPNRLRGLRRRWPPSARSGIREANSSTATRLTSRCETRYLI